MQIASMHFKERAREKLSAKYGLKRMLPIMVAGMYLSKVAFVFLAYTQPNNFLITCGACALA